MKPEFRPGDKVQFIGPESPFTRLFEFNLLQLYVVEEVIEDSMRIPGFNYSVRLRGKCGEPYARKFILIEEATP